jgi:hypothetical protein
MEPFINTKFQWSTSFAKPVPMAALLLAATGGKVLAIDLFVSGATGHPDFKGKWRLPPADWVTSDTLTFTLAKQKPYERSIRYYL